MKYILVSLYVTWAVLHEKLHRFFWQNCPCSSHLERWKKNQITQEFEGPRILFHKLSEAIKPWLHQSSPIRTLVKETFIGFDTSLNILDSALFHSSNIMAFEDYFLLTFLYLMSSIISGTYKMYNNIWRKQSLVIWKGWPFW